MFDSIIKDAAEKFGLGDKAGTLVSALLALMTDRENGGFNGFLNRFRRAGLGDLADSWINAGANTPISYEQTESAFGTETLTRISEQAGVDYKTATSATAYVIPSLVNDLTPNGEIPAEEDLLSRIGGYLSGVGSTPVGATGAAGSSFDRVDASVGGSADNFTGDKVDDRNSLLSWLLPLLILGLLIAAGFSLCGRSEPVAVVNTNTNRAPSNTNTVLNANSSNVSSGSPAATIEPISSNSNSANVNSAR